jgi:hypothetical protein
MQEITVAENKKSQLDERWDNTVKTQVASENDFEKKITYISGGALAISVALLPTVANGCCKWILFTGWAVLICSLVYNLIQLLATISKCLSEYETLASHYKTLTLPDDERDRQTKICKISLAASWINLIISVLGIGCVLVFFAINI